LDLKEFLFIISWWGNGIFFKTQEVKSLLEELSLQKGELNVHISEKKTQLALIKQEIEKEEENLQVVLQQMSKHKTGKFKGK
jgi:triosephosphate isomerase